MALSNDELNPEHPVTKGLHDRWHVLCLVLIDKLNQGREVLITKEDLENVEKKYPDHAILAHERKDGLHLSILTATQAKLKSLQ